MSSVMCTKCAMVCTKGSEYHFGNTFMEIQNGIYYFHPDFHDYMFG
jgi:hypothetical protein